MPVSSRHWSPDGPKFPAAQMRSALSLTEQPPGVVDQEQVAAQRKSFNHPFTRGIDLSPVLDRAEPQCLFQAAGRLRAGHAASPRCPQITDSGWVRTCSTRFLIEVCSLSSGVGAIPAATVLIVDYLAYRPRHQAPSLSPMPTPDVQLIHHELSDANERLKRLLAEKQSLTTQLSNRAYQQLQVEAENYKLRREKTDSNIVSPSLARDPKLQGQWRLWRPGVTLKVQFLDGNEGLKTAVRNHASEWCRYANINFDFDTTDEDACIRVTFEQPGSWSAIGVDALTIRARRTNDEPRLDSGHFSGRTGAGHPP